MPLVRYMTYRTVALGWFKGKSTQGLGAALKAPYEHALQQFAFLRGRVLRFRRCRGPSGGWLRDHGQGHAPRDLPGWVASAALQARHRRADVHPTHLRRVRRLPRRLRWLDDAASGDALTHR